MLLEESLQQLRKHIDEIDNNLLELLNRRMGVVRQVGELKRNNNAIIYRPEREKNILDRLEGLSKEGLLNRPAIEAIFMEIFAASRNFELPERVAYLGPEGSFTHQAAESRFGSMNEYIPLSSIRAVFESVDTERVRFGVIPIENNQEGVIGETLDYLDEIDVKIVAEILLPIHHSFGSTIDRLSDIRYVYSKDVAFKQCRRFLREYFPDEQIQLIPVESTSRAAQMAMQTPESAAICSTVAAKLYQLPVLFSNIEDNPNNTTRFFIISKKFSNQKSTLDKTTITARIVNKPGSLAGFLQEFSRLKVNITKIESRPEREKDRFSSWFFIEFDGHFEDEQVQQILGRYEAEIRWLGSYVKLC